MAYLYAFALFVGLAAACWYGSVIAYRGSGWTPDPAAAPDFRFVSIMAVGLTALTSFLPFPLGYLAGLVAWAITAFSGLGLPARKAFVFWLYLAVGSYLTRLLVRGVMDML